VGPLFQASISDQFTRWRAGDRFWWEIHPLCDASEVAVLGATRLADVIERNVGVEIPGSAFATYSGEDAEDAGESGMTLSADAGLELSWEVDGADLILTLTVADGPGWVGVGIGSSMAGADMVLVSLAGEEPTVSDYWSASNSRPVLDTDLGGTDDAVLVSSLSGGGLTTVVVRRPLVGGDTVLGLDSDIGAGVATDIIWAYGAWRSGQPQYHMASGRGVASVIFPQFLDVRSLDGAENNELNPDWGATGSAFGR
jgi:hypothetical protein